MSSMQSAAVFDPSVHLAYKEPAERVTMKELGLEGGISPIAVTAPFPLFSLEGVTERKRSSNIVGSSADRRAFSVRRNILSDGVQDKFTVSSYISAFQGREFTKNVAPFVHGQSLPCILCSSPADP